MGVFVEALVGAVVVGFVIDGSDVFSLVAAEGQFEGRQLGGSDSKLGTAEGFSEVACPVVGAVVEGDAVEGIVVEGIVVEGSVVIGLGFCDGVLLGDDVWLDEGALLGPLEGLSLW